MIRTSIVLIAGLIFLIRYEPPEVATEFNNSIVIFWACVLTIFPLALAYLIKKITDIRSSALFDILSLVCYIYILYRLNLPEFINQQLAFLDVVSHTREILYLFPLFICLLFIRVLMQELPWEAHRKRYEEIKFHFKSLILPMIPLLIWHVILDFSEFFPAAVGAFLLLILFMMFLTLPYIFAPLMMQFLWKTEQLNDIVLKERLKELANRSGIKYKDVVVCNTGAFPIVNAAVAGILPRNRRIFITETLLRYFTHEQIETIVAHEIGHIRHKHLLISCFLSFFFILSFTNFHLWVSQPLITRFDGVPHISAILTILFFVFYFKVFFNFLSRRFEHQADLYAVHLTNKPEEYKSALENLVSMRTLPKPIRFIVELFDTHPPIDKRIAFLDKESDSDYRIQRYKKCLLEVRVLFMLIPLLFYLIYRVSL